MHKYLVPGTSLALAAAIAGVGYWRFLDGRAVLRDENNFQSAPNFGWPIAIGLGLAFTGFVFARYVAGMAKQPVWAPLKSGAAAAVGAALAGLALATTQFIDYIGPNTFIIWLNVVFPAAMFVVAAEFVLNFLLGIYRPRKPGEIPPPAFNSRLLGFIAAPDKIAESIGGALSYQFGFDVTGSWFYQLLSRSLTALAAVGILVMWGMTSLTVVQPNEQGMRLILGRRVSETPLQAGPYFKWPWPIETIETFPATAARRINLGGEPPKLKAGRSVLWTNDHGVTETYFAVQPTAAEKAAAAGDDVTLKGAKDVALVSAEIPLFYAVTDLVKFENFAAPDQREDIMRSLGRREVFRYLATTDVDKILGDGREAVSKALRERVQARFTALDAGIEVLFIGVEGVHPPRDTAISFESVVQSGQIKERDLRIGESDASQALVQAAGSVDLAQQLVSLIREYEQVSQQGAAPGQAEEHSKKVKELERRIEDQLLKASGSAGSAIQQARAERWVKHMTRKIDADSHEGRLAAFRVAPQAYVAQTYFQTLLQIMKEARVFFVADNGKIEIRTDLTQQDIGGNIFVNPKQPPAQ